MSQENSFLKKKHHNMKSELYNFTFDYVFEKYIKDFTDDLSTNEKTTAINENELDHLEIELNKAIDKARKFKKTTCDFRRKKQFRLEEKYKDANNFLSKFG